jgi:Na+/proline symporter
VSLGGLGLAAAAVYLLALAAIAELARRARRDRTPADHFLAARGLGTLVLFLTLYATAYSGNSLLGYPGEAYRRGFSWVMATGFMLAIVVGLHVLVPPLRPLAVAHRFVTPGDWLRHRFGGEPGARALRLAIGVLMSVALGNFLLAQLTAMGIVASQLTAGAIPFWAGVVGLAGAILAYETVGGMRAVAWTDAAQGVLMLVGLGTLLGWLLGDTGGLGEVTRQVGGLRPAAVAVPDGRECANWASSVVLLGVGSLVYPQLLQRVYAAESARTLRRSLALMSAMPLLTTTVVTLVGIAAIPRFAALGHLEADAVMPRLLGEWAAAGPGHTLAAVLVFLGALAAIMSTADSVLLSLGSVVAGDLLERPNADPATTRVGKRAAAVVMAGAVLLALSPRLTLWRLIELKMELLLQCAPAFLLALHWRRLAALPALLGLALGTGVAVAGMLADVPRLGGVHLGVLGLAANLAVAVGGSLARATPPARVRSAAAGLPRRDPA